jgi:hypothetical protein
MLRFRSRHVSRRCQVLSHAAQSGHLGGHGMPERTESIAFLPTGPWGSAPFGRSSWTGSQLGCSIEELIGCLDLGGLGRGNGSCGCLIATDQRVLPIRFTRLGAWGLPGGGETGGGTDGGDAHARSHAFACALSQAEGTNVWATHGHESRSRSGSARSRLPCEW